MSQSPLIKFHTGISRASQGWDLTSILRMRIDRLAFGMTCPRTAEVDCDHFRRYGEGGCYLENASNHIVFSHVKMITLEDGRWIPLRYKISRCWEKSLQISPLFSSSEDGDDESGSPLAIDVQIGIPSFTSVPTTLYHWSYNDHQVVLQLQQGFKEVEILMNESEWAFTQRLRMIGGG